MAAKLQTAVVGATGYAGFELACLLRRHSRLATPLLFERQKGNQPGRDLGEVFPRVSGNGSLPLEPFSWEKLQTSGVDLLFLSTPHELSRQWVPEAINRGLRVVDLSGAWRLKCKNHRQIYGFNDADAERATQLEQQAVYGLPELHRRAVCAAQLVANPGCFATAIILALAPLVRAGVVALEQGVVCDAKSGVSGAGKESTARTHFVEVADNLSAYAVFGHRHTGEILEQLKLAAGDLMFTPHLLPIPRGILSTIYVRLRKSLKHDDLAGCFRDFYAQSPWVRLFPAGTLPEIKFSLHTNFCDIGISSASDGQRVVIISCLDNLVKGAAGQAVQNMNLMFGWDEREGLK